MAHARSRLHWLAWAVLVSASLLALIGWAHTRSARPLMAAISSAFGAGPVTGRSAVCPFGFDRPVSAAERARSRLAFAQSHAGATRAGARPAAGFLLAASTRADLLAWSSRHHVDCHPRAKGPDLECRAVPGDALPAGHGDAHAALETVWLAFDESERLDSVIIVQRTQDARSAWGAFDAASRETGQLAGAAPRREGEASADALATSLLRQASAEFRFRDYYALMRVTNMGSSFLLTEEFRVLPG